MRRFGVLGKTTWRLEHLKGLKIIFDVSVSPRQADVGGDGGAGTWRLGGGVLQKKLMSGKDGLV